DGNLQVTTDGGATWRNVATNVAAAGIPAQTWVSSVEPSRFDRNTVYATFDNHMYGDHRTYLARSTDMGASWTLLRSPEFTGFAHRVREDPVNRNLLFLGTEMGLFASLDGGAEWFRMKNNIPWMALVRDIQIHPVTHDLVVATHGRGIIIVDDITPMRVMDKPLLAKEFHLFEIPSITLSSGQFGGGGVVNGGYAAPNPPGLPAFQYYLRDRLSSGGVRVEVVDSEGKTVQSFPGTARKGLNKVYWNQRMQPPKTASGSTKRDISAFFAPQVLPGDYTLRVKVGQKVYETPLRIVHDAASTFSEAERRQRHIAAMDLYRMHEDLAAVVNDITARQKLLKDSLPKLTKEKPRKALQAQVDKLEALRAELIPTKQTSIFADETRLREDITEVYVAVCSNEQAPTNLQLERVKELRAKVDDARLRLDGMLKGK
ncbi:MAG: exo-alpha-sialidase, partial [Chitinophagia bacterium]|nr:exo-alpha-sialidase [Chitinophagia bacterium]